jgi:class 3 adenylate cyclase/nitrite reductase/ring-hydroxylating ferredoxin subunit
MPKLMYVDTNKSYDFKSGKSILNVSISNNVNHLHACGGLGKCSTCRVQITEGLDNCAPRSDKEQNIAEKLEFPDDIRLACQTTLNGDVAIRTLFKKNSDIKFAQAALQSSGSIGSNKNVAILFADIENFTPLSERLETFDVMYLLNRYFDFAGDIVMRNGGEINNYIGDAFLAIFGLDNAGDETFRAVKAGLELQSELKDFANSVEESFDELFRVRIGIHFGEAIIGMLGCRGTERLSVIGDTVNMAARAETANKEADTEMLITENAYEQIQDRVQVKDFIRTKLKGTSERITLYEIESIIGESTSKDQSDLLVKEGIKWRRVAPSSQLSESAKIEFNLNGDDVLLFRYQDEVRAVSGSCTHMNLPLAMGEIDRHGNIACPFHGTSYCTKEGSIQKWCEGISEDEPAEKAQMMKSLKKTPLKTYTAMEYDNTIWIDCS